MTPIDRALLTSDVAELGLPKDAIDLLAQMRRSVSGSRCLFAADVAPAGDLIRNGLIVATDEYRDGIIVILTGKSPPHA